MHSSSRPGPSPVHLRSHAKRYTPLDFVQVRTPLFPIEAYLTLQEPLATPKAELHPQNPLVRRALAIGSIDLLEELDRPSSSSRERERRERKLLRYLIRMATRPTPYGLFAGVSLAHWGKETDLQIANLPRTLFSRPDLSWLLPLLWELEALPEIRRHLHYLANEAVSVRQGRIFLQEQLALGQPNQSESVSIRATPVALHTLKLARQPVSHSNLVQALLAAAPGVTVSKVEELITTLWQHTLLYTDLHPPLTGETLPAQYVLQRLEHIPFAASVVPLLQDFLHSLTAWDQASNEESLERYRDLRSCAQAINANVEALCYGQRPTYRSQVERKKGQAASSVFVQTDTTFPLVGQRLAQTIGEEVASFAPQLLRLRGPDYLQAYRMAFLERYGADREVPLLEVIDSQFGLGIPAFAQESPSNETNKQTERDQELSRLALTALRERQCVISLTEESLQRLALVPPDDKAILPPSFDIFVLLAARSSQALARGEYQIVIGPNLWAYQAGQTLGRFASHLGEVALQALADTARQETEQNPHILPAELVYTSAFPRAMNVALRPAVRTHEIIYGVMPGVETEHAIPLDELVLGVREERFYLRWSKHEVEVRPCSGHMLNASHAPAIIRFLSDLCLDGVHKLSQFEWGSCTRFPFLPRLQVGRVVFSLAQWSLSSSFHVDELCLDSSAQFQKTLVRWRERWQVPRYVYLAERDNRLLLDLEQFNQAEELRSTLQARKDTQMVILQEALPGPEHAWLEGPGGHYLSEYVVSLIKRPSMAPAEPAIITSYASTGEQRMVVNTERLKGPGSEWLFLKLYCASTLQDDLITGPLRTLLQEVFAQKLAEGWFFIRYGDPDPHIRLRFRGNPHLLTSRLFPTLCTWATKLVSDGPCRKFVFDSYEREIERYGGREGIVLSEKLFEADSSAVMELLQLKRTRKLTLDSQMLAVLTTDDLLAGLGLSPQERLQWYWQHVSTTREAGAIYRQKSVELRALLHNTQYVQDLQGGKQLMEVLDERRVRLSQIGQEFVGLATRRDLKPAQLYASFTHMHYNRLQGLDRKEERYVLELARRTCMGLDRHKTALPEAW